MDLPSTKRVFCNSKCHGEWMGKQKGSNTIRWKGGNLISYCEYCDKEFEISPYENGIRRFCSRKCDAKWRSINLSGENSPTWKGKIKINCKYCNKEFEIYPSWVNFKVFCSRKCYGLWLHENKVGEKSPNWQGGLSYGKYCYKFNDEFKEKIRNQFNRLCFLCSKDEIENNKKLDVHHVNYDKDCLCNGNCEFVPLCRSCHIKTNFKRQYWEDLIMCYLYPNRITMVDL